jgi:glycosyltransferase involved in cell wall biosynthesis
MPISDHIFVQSEQMKKDVIAMGISASKLTSVPMGVSLSRFEPYRRKAVEENSSMGPSIVYLGTLQRARKMEFMLRVMKIVLQQNQEAILYFVGDGDGIEDRKYLENYAEKLGIKDSLVITGFLPQDEAMKYVRQAAVCVSPFYPTPVLNSTSPTKLVEYMAMEKAVVASDHPEQRRIIEQSQAGLCVPYREDDFAEAILDLLRSPHKRDEMGQRGRRYVEEYRDYKRIADRLEEKYYQLLDEASV